MSVFILKMQKWATQLKFQRHSLYLKIFFFQLLSEFFVSLDGKDFRNSPSEYFQKGDGKLKKWPNFKAILDYLQVSPFKNKLNERVFMVFPVIERFVDTIQHETELK